MRYADDPVAWLLDFVDFQEDEGLTDYQEDALRKLIEKRRVSLRGPRGFGKTALASWSILWFAVTHPVDTKIPTTASSWKQLEKFLWPEIHKWYRRVRWPMWRSLGGIVPEIFSLKMEVGDQCEAFAIASDRPDLMEGAHGTNLFYVFDESKAIPTSIWDSAEGAFSTGEGYWMAVSTPGERGGRFFQIHRRAPGFERWFPIHVTLEQAVAAGRVSREWAEDMRRQWGEDHPLYEAHVLGEFPEHEEDALISLSWVMAARDNELEPSGDPIVGVDIARFGADDSCMVGRQGDVVLGVEIWHGNDLMQSTGKIKNRGFPANVDSIGVGAGVVDRLHEQKYAVHGINVADAARDKEHFKNLRAELYWNLRERFKAGDIDLSRLPVQVFDRLTGELTSLRFEYKSTGQIQIEAKDAMKKRLGHSPDIADALALAFAPGLPKAKVLRLAGQ